MSLKGGPVDDPGLQQTLDDFDQRLAALEVVEFAGPGSPENVVTANIGATYRSYTGGANTTLYVKESGGSNTGWIAK